jgi:hypothetical protein
MVHGQFFPNHDIRGDISYLIRRRLICTVDTVSLITS